jgi:hypothetical protein
MPRCHTCNTPIQFVQACPVVKYPLCYNGDHGAKRPDEDGAGERGDSQNKIKARDGLRNSIDPSVQRLHGVELEPGSDKHSGEQEQQRHALQRVLQEVRAGQLGMCKEQAGGRDDS